MSGNKEIGYCRKQKSLGLLCTNFLSLYNHDHVQTIGVDDAATRLGVERRRIYDIVNVLESIGMLARFAKNSYSWSGFAGVPKVLHELKEQGLKEGFNTFEVSISNCSKASDDEDENALSSISLSQDSNPNHGSASGSSMGSKTENKKEKSLALLTQNFVKLFLCSNVDLISLEEAAKLLLGAGHNAPVMRNQSAAKVRRLYDIANVLSSMNFIEKTHHPDTRKPAFRWLGMKRKAENGSKNSNISNECNKRIFGTDMSNNENTLNQCKKRILGTDISNNENTLNQCKKRVFGTDISNTNVKMSYSVPQFVGGLNEISKVPLEMKLRPELKFETKSNSDQNSREGRNDYRFGPFSPVTVPKTSAGQNSKLKLPIDMESLASTYRPQYQNQALKDLFSHYAEAWGLWYSEVAGKS